MIVIAPLLVTSARIWAMALVPFAKFSISKTPIGPFQTTVFAVWRILPYSSTVLGPISRICQPSGISSDVLTVFVLARSEEHTSELQSLAYLVCRLLLEKKKRTL